jgi:Fic family protein
MRQFSPHDGSISAHDLSRSGVQSPRSRHQDKALTARQRTVVNLLLDASPQGFEGGVSTRKYESIGSTSRATASRELIELEDMGLLCRVGAGRSTRYYLNISGWSPANTAFAETPTHNV